MGSKLLYYFVILPISSLPYGIIYLLSNFIFFILFYPLKYRNNVIENNLKNSFPEKSNDQIYFIKKEFYKHFADIIIESLKGFTISEKNIQK